MRTTIESKKSDILNEVINLQMYCKKINLACTEYKRSTLDMKNKEDLLKLRDDRVRRITKWMVDYDQAGVYKTIQDRIEKWIEANNPETYKELMLNVHKIIHEEIFENLDERLYGFNRSMTYYGTWKIALWVNEFHFGEEIGKRLNGLHIGTHDEEKTGSLEDFEDDICTEIIDWAVDYWNEESWKNSVEQ